ncbi:hypothetical protein [Novosphingobium sp.]|uniref:hypothetical protein n=1 Tax=Novosphingobium sp. TaxID=1874826 RepID=UPI0035AFA1BB
MATLAGTNTGARIPDIEGRERRFFMGMAVLLALTVLTGFGLFIVVGISSFGAPWWVHVHGMTFMSWIALYLTQNWLVLRGNITAHRKLGRIGGLLAIWMVFVGMVLTPVTLAVHRSPPFFTPPQFLALDWVNIAVFAALIASGIALRRQTDWHRRLMLCATIAVIAPALGRILVLAGHMSPWNNAFALLGYIGIAMVADMRIRGRVHPAYFVGAAAILAMGFAIQVLSTFLPLVSYAGGLVGG